MKHTTEAMDDKPKQILLASLNNLGDCIMFLPVAAALSKHYPDAEMTLLTGRGTAEAAQLTRLFNRFITPPCSPAGRKVKHRASLLRLLPAIRRKRFDLSIMASGESSYMCAALFLGRIRKRVGFNDCKLRGLLSDRVCASAHGEENEGRRNLRLLGALELPTTLHRPPCHLSESALGHARELMQQAGADEESALPIVLIHPGSATPNRRWPVEAFAELCHRMIDQKIAQPVLVEGPYETDVCGRIAATAALSMPILAQLPTMEILAAVMRHCDLFLGHDTGTLHLAFLVGVPTVSLWGISDPGQWGPLWEEERHRIIRSSLQCGPDDDISRRNETLPCMKAIAVDEVLDAVECKLEAVQ